MTPVEQKKYLDLFTKLVTTPGPLTSAEASRLAKVKEANVVRSGELYQLLTQNPLFRQRAEHALRAREAYSDRSRQEAKTAMGRMFNPRRKNTPQRRRTA